MNDPLPIIQLTVTNEENVLLCNALNEVMNGFLVPDFDRRVGVLDDVERLRRHVSDVLDAARGRDEILISLDAGQLRIFVNAIKEVLKEMGGDELHARTGCDEWVARDLLERLEKLQP